MMPCRQCSGLMVVDHFMNPSGTSGHMWVRGWHCVNCGACFNPHPSCHDRQGPRWISVMAEALLTTPDQSGPKRLR